MTLIDFKTAIADIKVIMKHVSAMPLPAERALHKLGRDLSLARRKRSISTASMAERLFVSRDTVWRLESGDPTVAVGTLASAMFILCLEDRVANLAAPSSDSLALGLDESRVPKRIHSPKKSLNK